MIYFLSGEGDKLERLINALTRIQVTLIFYHIDSEEQKIMMGSKKNECIPKSNALHTRRTEKKNIKVFTAFVISFMTRNIHFRTHLGFFLQVVRVDTALRNIFNRQFYNYWYAYNCTKQLSYYVLCTQPRFTCNK